MFKVNATVAALAIAASAGAQAATINDDSVIVNILKDSTDPTSQSMLIDTGVSAADFINGTNELADGVWTSDDVAGLTAAINGFLGGSTNAQFWAIGRQSGATKDLLSTASFNDKTLIDAAVDTNVPGFISNANAGFFGTNSGSNPWAAGIPDGDNNHFDNANITGSGLVSKLSALQAGGTSGDFFLSQTGFFPGGVNAPQTLDTWALSGNGTLAYGVSVAPVPLPAAAWLFAPGLMGLYGMSRRAKAAKA